LNLDTRRILGFPPPTSIHKVNITPLPSPFKKVGKSIDEQPFILLLLLLIFRPGSQAKPVSVSYNAQLFTKISVRYRGDGGGNACLGLILWAEDSKIFRAASQYNGVWGPTPILGRGLATRKEELIEERFILLVGILKDIDRE
jgi:hypothetical protein